MNPTELKNFACWLLLVLTGAGPAALMAQEPDTQVLISNVIVNRSNIFPSSTFNDDDRSPQSVRLLAAGVNQFHRITRESVILREAGIRPGDTITLSEVEEVERRLRRLGIFAAVSADLVTGDSGIELHISTQDNFSIIAGFTGSFLGGIGNIGFTLGERNILGTANNLRFGLARSTDDDFRGSLQFTDRHFFATSWQANYSIERTEEGNAFGVQLQDPFRSLSDTRRWSLVLDYDEFFNSYFVDGNTVLQIPEDRSRLIARHIWRSGNSDRFFRKGAVASLQQSVYSAPNGMLAGVFRPDDTRIAYIGGLLASDRLRGFREVQGLDTLNFVQDVRFGSTVQLELGVNLVDDFDVDDGSRIDPRVAVLLDNAMAAGSDSLVRTTLSGNAVFEETGERPWNAVLRLAAYNTALSNTTLAFNADFTTGEDGSDLPVQLTLGENNGLRGYDTRQFQGRQRLRLNLEARYHAGWRIGILDIGIIGFADAGWAGERGASTPDFNRSVGAGLRLASNSILGQQVIRIDLAMPLDVPQGDNSGPRLSAAVGQVFRF